MADYILGQMLTASPSLADRFTWLFDGLCKVIGVDAQRQRVEAALAWAIWHRVRLLGDRLIALAERVRAGRMRARIKKSPHPCPPPQERERGRTAALEGVRLPTASLPREFGWVRRMLPETGQYAGLLSYLLRDPETVALLEKAPQAGRVLRPLCHLLGVQPPEFLRRGATPAPVAAEIPAPAPLEASIQAADATVTSDEGVTPAAEQPAPQSGRSAAEEAAVAYARRPGGLYWDGTRLRWS